MCVISFILGQFEWDGKGFSKDAKEVFLKIESDSKEPMLYAKLPDKIYRELVQQKVNLSERIFNDNGKLGFLSRKDKSLPFTAGEIGTLKFDYEHVIFVELKNDHDDWTCSELDLNFYIGNHDGNLYSMYFLVLWYQTNARIDFHLLGQFAWDSSCYQSPDTRNIQFMVLGTAKIPYLRAELRNNRGEWNLRTLNLSERIINSNGTLVVRPAN